MGRTVLLTGATRGLGRAMAEAIAEEGYTILGCGRNASHIAELRKRFGKAHDFAVVDVSRSTEVEVWAKHLLGVFQPPDLILNNAALVNATASLWKVSTEEFSTVVDVNIKGVFHVIRYFVPAMVNRGTGIIINFSSGWGRSTSPEVAPYCATKFAVEGLSQALSQELPKGMASIALNPGIIHTEMLRSCFGEEASSYDLPVKWAGKAVPYILSLGPKDNGKSLSCPQ